MQLSQSEKAHYCLFYFHELFFTQTVTHIIFKSISNLFFTGLKFVPGLIVEHPQHGALFAPGKVIETQEVL